MEEEGIYIYEKEAYIKRGPNWMFRWGIVLVFGFFVFTILFASFFSYSDYVKASVLLTTLNPPIHIKATRTGRIAEVNNRAGDTVAKDAVLGVLENTGNAKDIIELKQKLTSEYPLVLKLEDLAHQFPSHLRLGSIVRPFYNRFLNAYRNLVIYRSLDNGALEENQLHQQRIGQTNAINNKMEEILVLQRDLEIVQIDLNRYQDLFVKGVISQRDLEKKETEYLKVKREFGNQEQQLNYLRLEESRIRNSQMQFDNIRLKNENIYSSKLELEQEELISALTEWEDQYLLKSPISGRVSFFEVWGNHQNIKEGQIVFTVVPMDGDRLLGKCKVPIRNSGKIKPGQHVIIKLENYPYREWGTINGEVEIISEVPRTGDNEGYVVYVKVNNLVTTYGKTLQFKQDMIGSVEIILEEVTLLQRIFYQFKNLWTNT
ncbi:HlyD family efflux transporter periplasmic adaptor subunit [Arenibacter sp. S6351L]|uniref:HlyD family secretion protein n=1 Tax=Arenibacter sp. S6351L TaxID=2926407 RepID=UPI001FF11ED9|nr:HlyD family efflux transporter periplasmic adaptor subunit [Arenibacter sp. S6351L]MCK0135894.1 HlyD family secretion protein [Arenibacter sp. S6351L]